MAGAGGGVVWGLEPEYEGKGGEIGCRVFKGQQWCQIHLQKDHSGVRIPTGEEQPSPSHGHRGKPLLLGMQSWAFRAASGEGFRQG